MLKKSSLIIYVWMICNAGLWAQINTVKSRADSLALNSGKSQDSLKIIEKDNYSHLFHQLNELKHENFKLKEQLSVLRAEFEHLKQLIRTKGIFQKDTLAIPKIDFVQIASDTFMMGSPLSEPSRGYDETQFHVYLNTFKISKFEITNAQYAQFLNSMHVGSDGINKFGLYPEKKLIYQNTTWGLIFFESKWFPVKGYENNPVVNVTWYGADEFSKFVGGRLPSEAEWEYSCRAKTNTPFCTGDCLNDTHANYDWLHRYPKCSSLSKTKPNKTKPVGSFSPNAFGLFDMHGNANEWCNDWYAKYETTPQKNPQGTMIGSQKIIRGGGWDGSAWHCRSASRFSNSPNYENDGLGFRVVVDVK